MSHSDNRIYKLSRGTRRRLAAPGPVGVTLGLQVQPAEVAYLTIRVTAAKPERVFGLHLGDADQDPFSLEELAEMNAYLARGGTAPLLAQVLDQAAASDGTLRSALQALGLETTRTIALVPRGERVALRGLQAATTEVSLALDDGCTFRRETGITGFDIGLADGSDACAVCVSDRRARISPWFIVRDLGLVDVLNADVSRRLARGLEPVAAATQLVEAVCGSTPADRGGVSR